MNTRRILSVILIMAVIGAIGACKKNRYCHCVTTEGAADTVVVNVDRGMKCEHILELGFERLVEGQSETTTQKVDCVELDVDTVATIPPRP
jgi:hypothetical protein